MVEALASTRRHKPSEDDPVMRRKYVLFVFKTVLTTFDDPDLDVDLPVADALLKVRESLASYLHDGAHGSLQLVYQLAEIVVEDLLPTEGGAVTRVRPVRDEHLRRLLHVIRNHRLTLRQLEIPALTSLHDPGFKPHPTLRTLAEDHDKMLPDRHANLAGGHDANVAFALAMLMAPGLRVLMNELLSLDEFDFEARGLGTDEDAPDRDHMTLTFFWRVAMLTDGKAHPAVKRVSDRTGWGRFRTDYPLFSAVLDDTFTAADDTFTRSPAFTRHAAWLTARALLS